MTERAAAGEPITDALTGAYSRALLGPRIAEELSRAARTSVGCAVFLFDVDYFKSVNDAYGHGRGDAVLCELVTRIQGLIRGYDLLFRYGGDEFVLLLPETTRAEALDIALRVTDGVRGHPFAGDPPLRVSVSLGVATYPDDGADAEELLACADKRNYLAKQRGRACAVADDAEVDGPVAYSRLLERDTQLAVVHEFLTRLNAAGAGALRVAGEPGAGHSRFLEMIARVATLRGFTPMPVDSALDWAGWPPGPATRAGVLLLADRDPAGVAADAVAAVTARAAGQGSVGLVYTCGDLRAEPPGTDLPVLSSVELLPWTPAAVRIWLRTTLPGEPEPPLVDWLVGRTGGLPGPVERELDRLRAQGGLVRSEAGTWTVAPGLLAKPKRRRRLPNPVTEFVGRQRELAEIAHLLADRRLVTLVGPGGIGKTRLALAVATAVEDRFADGAVFVPLADAGTEDLVVGALAGALGLAEVPGQALVDTIADHLADRSVLLIADNFEQVLSAAGVLGALLAAAPGLRVLATSRERLGLYGEQVYEVGPLPLPEPLPAPAGPGDIAAVLAESPAVALFHTRARAAAYDFTLTPADLCGVIELCRRLDGLPLAIELAAARCGSLSPAQMLDQLGRHLAVLGDGPRDLPARQRTLGGTIDWSVALLDPADQELLARLAVFAGGSDGPAVLAVAGSGADAAELGRRLNALADKSLIRVEPGAEDGPRYTMLRTIQLHQQDRLARSGQADALRGRHAEYYAGLAELAGQGLTGPEQGRWAARIEQEYENLRAAFGCALEQAATDPATRLVLGLWRFWRAGSHLREGREWLTRLLAVGSLPERGRARVLHAASVLACAQDDHELAAALAADCLRLARAAGDAEASGQAYNALGTAALGVGDLPAAAGHFADSLAIWTGLGAPMGMAIAHGNLARVALAAGDIPVASQNAARCLELDRQQGNTRGVMLGQLCLGEILLAQGDTAGARERLTEALDLARTLGDIFGAAMALHHLGSVAWLEGDPARALRLTADAAARRRDVGDRGDLAVSMEQLGGLLVADHPELATRLLAAADAIRSRHRVGHYGDRADVERTLAALRTRLPEVAFRRTWQQGRAEHLDLVIDEALHLVQQATPTT